MSGTGPAGDFDYERHGAGYAAQRRTDPLIASHIDAALGSARTVLNVGAGAGIAAGAGLGPGAGLVPGAGLGPGGFAGWNHLTTPLATLLDLADRPGELHGLGPADPWQVRDLATASAAGWLAGSQRGIPKVGKVMIAP